MPTAEQHCPGTCNARYRREQALFKAAQAEHDQIAQRLTDADMADRIPPPPKPPATRPMQGEPVWCPRCKAVIRRELVDLDDLAMSLAALPPGIRPAFDGSAEQIRSARSIWAPSPSPAADDLDELYSWLVAWEGYYREVRQWDNAPPRGYLADRITSVVNWLAGKFDGLLMTELAEPFGLETRAWHRELITKTHSARSAKHVKKRCPRCDLFTLWEEIGKDYIRCVNTDCNRMMTREELDDANSNAAQQVGRQGR